MSYLTLDNYNKNTSFKEERQDITVSKCLGGVCAVGAQCNKQLIQENYGSMSLRGSVRPPYSQQWGNNCSTDIPKYPAVS